MEKYIDYEMCKECGGECCKQTGCVYMPQDFKKMDYEYLKDILNRGNISISGQPFNGFYKDGWTFMLYLRARNVNSEIVDLISHGGPCKLLTSTGCSLKEKDRPRLGLLVRPTVIGGPCKKEFTSEYAEKWLYYNNVLERLVKHYTKKSVTEVISDQITGKIAIIKQKIKNKEELNSNEKIIANWFYNIMANKPYYTPEEVKVLRKCINLY